MARILVVGAHRTLAEQSVQQMLVAKLRDDLHDASRLDDEADLLQAIADADALVAVLDGLTANGSAAIAAAHAKDKPVLGLATRGTETPPIVAQMTQLVEGSRMADWTDALPAFYDDVRPFAGRVVRDRIPELVREAGHEVTFRQLTAEERPRFLKQKVANEAQQLLGAELGKEKEKVADVLEAMEAFITARNFERDDLRRVKEHKRKQRGAFERCFVVESTLPARQADAPEPAPVAAAVPEPTPEAPSAPTPTGTPQLEGDAPSEEETDVLEPGRNVRAEFFEI